ncbi:hypothetical protein V6N13_036664 [Hibiscus sabdariffa]
MPESWESVPTPIVAPLVQSTYPTILVDPTSGNLGHSRLDMDKSKAQGKSLSSSKKVTIHHVAKKLAASGSKVTKQSYAILKTSCIAHVHRVTSMNPPPLSMHTLFLEHLRWLSTLSSMKQFNFILPIIPSFLLRPYHVAEYIMAPRPCLNNLP